MVNSKLGPVRAVCGFEGQVGERHQQNVLSALLKPCEPFVGRSCQRQLPRKTEEPHVTQNPAPPPLGGGVNLVLGTKTKRAP